MEGRRKGGRKGGGEGGRRRRGVPYLAQPFQGFLVVGLHDARPWLRRMPTRRDQA